MGDALQVLWQPLVGTPFLNYAAAMMTGFHYRLNPLQSPVMGAAGLFGVFILFILVPSWALSAEAQWQLVYQDGQAAAYSRVGFF